MWLDMRISSDKANSQTGNIRVYLMAAQKGQCCKILSSRDLKKFMLICWKIQQGASGPGDSAFGVMYLFWMIHPKS